MTEPSASTIAISNVPVLPSNVVSLCEAITDAGGHALIVGGFVRDHLLGLSPKDIDIEVFGLDADTLESTLAKFGEVITVGRAFGVFKVKHIDADISLPRRDNKVAPGHRGFEVVVDTGLTFAEAARRRDFTINSIGLDPLTGTLIDPYDGQRDLKARQLRATDAIQFSEDPLRGLRAAQFIARFDLEPDDSLIALCRALDLSELPGERCYEEFRKLLLKGVRPSLGLAFLKDTGQLEAFPELAALCGVPQDATWHPEGDVWVHTLMVVDEAVALRNGDADDALMFAALCHDFGKPGTTVTGDDGRVRSASHDTAGIPVTERFLSKMRASHQLIRCVEVLVETHLAPAMLTTQGAGAKAYRKLARKLEAGGATMSLLMRVASADHLGRTTEEALARQIHWAAPFQAAIDKALSGERAPTTAVGGRHLIERGFSPGPHFRAILDACQDIQDEMGWTDPAQILDEVLSTMDPPTA